MLIALGHTHHPALATAVHPGARRLDRAALGGQRLGDGDRIPLGVERFDFSRAVSTVAAELGENFLRERLRLLGRSGALFFVLTQSMREKESLGFERQVEKGSARYCYLMKDAVFCACQAARAHEVGFVARES